MFAAETYVERRKALMDRLGSGLVLLLGNDESPMNYADNTFHYRQDSTFLYYFGLNQPGLAAVIDVDESKETIFGNELTIDDIVWMGVLPTLVDRSAEVGVTSVQPSGDLGARISRALQAGRTVHVLPPYRPEHSLKLSVLLESPVSSVAESASLELIYAVAAQRIQKSEEEIAEVEKAVDVSVDMHVAAMKMTRAGMVEAEVAAEVHRIALAAGGQLAFPIILTKNGQTLHNHFHGHCLGEGDLVLCDFGAETALGYAGDLSSTFPVSSSFRPRQREIYQLSLDAHQAAADALAPGVPFRDVHLTACRVIAQGMKDLGLMIGNVDDAVAAGAHAMFFPCGTGHLLGLDVHDMENLGEVHVGYAGQPKSTQFGLKSLRLGRRLEPGFVLTIEPGIYFIPELMDLWRSQGLHTEFLVYDKLDAYRTFGGIRNEEDFLITDRGARVLGKAKPKTIEEIESIRANVLSD